MNTYKRFGNRWTVNECLQLQREFELLQLSVDEISQIHQRTPNAIMFKLDQEGFADYNVLYANYAKANQANQKNVVKYDESDEDESEEDESEEDESSNDESSNDESEEDNQSLKQRVMCLEKQISSLATLILENTNSKKNRSFLY
jgi:Ran GTPase-activating protein (RanGAP) involved in mRNA processing and transport